MIRTIDCEQVFDVLTRAPFPSGDARDERVEFHLRHCHECRQLAEALRPAIGMFHESLDEPGDRLPGYRGTIPAASAPWLAVEPLPLAELDVVTRRGRQSQLALAGQAGRVRRAGLVAAAMIGLVIAGYYTSAASGPTAGWLGPRVAADAAGPTTANDRIEGQLWAAGVPADCIHRVSQREVNVEVASATENTVCCTQCHVKADSHRPGIKSFHSFLAACVACHPPTDRL